MNLKKLSVAAALSIGIMTVSGIALADQPCPICPPRPTGAACPICPPQVQPAAPCNPCQTCVPYQPVAPIGFAAVCQPIVGACPDATAGADVFERMAYAFPDIGDAGLVIPRGDALLQIGGDEEALAVSTTCPSGLTAYPAYGPVLNLMSKDDPEFAYTTAGVMNQYGGVVGAAAPWAGQYYTGAAGCCPTGMASAVSAACPVCPPCNNNINTCPVSACPGERITQGVEILRCGIPEQQTILSLYQNSPCYREAGILGAAVPVTPVVPCDPCAPVAPCPSGMAVPVNPCNPCNPCSPCPTGAAAPIVPVYPVNPCNPCNPCAPAIPLSSADTEDNIVPCSNDAGEEDEKAMNGEVPCDAFQPCPAAPVCPPQRVCPEPCPPPCPTAVAPVCPAVPVVPAKIGRRIQTSSGIQMQKNVLIPTQVPVSMPVTGAACPIGPQYPDVGNQTSSGCDVNKLTAKGILAGYPDRTYKPNLPIMRDEFASAMVSALELQNVPDFAQQIFRDVPTGHWANADIDKAYNRGLVSGYPDCTFKPDRPVSRAEALSAMGKVIPGDISAAEAQSILSCYTDSNEIPGWAALSVAEALNAGVIRSLPNTDQIRPNDSASRAEIASMIDELRQTLGLEPTAVTTGAATQLQPGVATSTIPTLKVQFEDIISARTSTEGDNFVAKTTEPVSIDGQLFPAGSEVHGEVVEVIRPGFGESGAIRVAFSELRYECDDANGGGGGQYSTSLPRDILSAVVVEEDAPNIIGRVLAWPFSWPGKVAGVAGRTVGGAAITASNMVENFLTNIANGNNELANLELAAAGRSYIHAASEVAQGVYYTGKTAVSGTLGVVKVTGDEIAYVVSPDGDRIAQINPDEVLSVAFACK